jgi:tagaturonate epimerase
MHVSFKVAAKMGGRYLNALKKHEVIIAKNVTENLFERHMKPLLLGK